MVGRGFQWPLIGRSRLRAHQQCLELLPNEIAFQWPLIGRSRLREPSSYLTCRLGFGNAFCPPPSLIEPTFCHRQVDTCLIWRKKSLPDNNLRGCPPLPPFRGRGKGGQPAVVGEGGREPRTRACARPFSSVSMAFRRARLVSAFILTSLWPTGGQVGDHTRLWISVSNWVYPLVRAYLCTTTQ